MPSPTATQPANTATRRLQPGVIIQPLILYVYVVFEQHLAVARHLQRFHAKHRAGIRSMSGRARHVRSLPRVHAVLSWERSSHSNAPRHALAVASSAEDAPHVLVHYIRRSAKLHAVLHDHAVWCGHAASHLLMLRGVPTTRAAANASMELRRHYPLRRVEWLARFFFPEQYVLRSAKRHREPDRGYVRQLEDVVHAKIRSAGKLRWLRCLGHRAYMHLLRRNGDSGHPQQVPRTAGCGPQSGCACSGQHVAITSLQPRFLLK